MLWSTKGGASSVSRLAPADLMIYFVSMWGILNDIKLQLTPDVSVCWSSPKSWLQCSLPSTAGRGEPRLLIAQKSSSVVVWWRVNGSIMDKRCSCLVLHNKELSEAIWTFPLKPQCISRKLFCCLSSVHGRKFCSWGLFHIRHLRTVCAVLSEPLLNLKATGEHSAETKMRQIPPLQRP